MAVTRSADPPRAPSAAAPDAVPEAPVAAAPPGTFAPLRVRSFRLLWIGSLIVFLGVMSQAIARTWVAYELTGSNAALGGVLLSFGLAMVLTTPLGGVLADRYPKRRVLQLALALLAATTAWIGIALATGVIAYWMLLVAGALQAVGASLYAPARTAFIADLVPRAQVPDGVGLMLVNAEVSRVVGPALAGVVIAASAVGAEAVFFVCAALFVAGMVAGIPLPPGRPSPGRSPASVVGELAEGLRHVLGRRELARLLWFGQAVVMLGLPYAAFLPTLSEEVFGAGATGYGLLSACAAAGAVVAGLTAGLLRRRVGSAALLLVGSAATFGAGLVVLGGTTSFAVALLVLPPLGAGLLVFQTTTQARMLALADARFHGRVQGLLMISFGGFAIAALPLGLLADAVGLRQTVVGMGVAVLLVAALFALLTRWRPPGPDSGEPAPAGPRRKG
jgi:predicted MFS family arabinose efflux permease